MHRVSAILFVAMSLAFPPPAGADEVRITVDRLEVDAGTDALEVVEALSRDADQARDNLLDEVHDLLARAGRVPCPVEGAGDPLASDAPPLCYQVDDSPFGLGLAPTTEVLGMLEGHAYHFAALVHGRSSLAGDVVQVRGRVATHPSRVLHIDFDYRAERWAEFRYLFRASLYYAVARAEATLGGVPVEDTADLLADAYSSLNDFATTQPGCSDGITDWAESTLDGAEPPPAPDAATGSAAPLSPEVIGVRQLCADLAAGLAEIDRGLRAKENS